MLSLIVILALGSMIFGGNRRRCHGSFLGGLLILPMMLFGGWIVIAVMAGVLGLIGSVIGGIFSGLSSLASGAFSGGGLIVGIVIGLVAYYCFRSRNARNDTESET